MNRQKAEKDRFAQPCYKVPSNEMLMKPSILGKNDKSKYEFGVIEGGAKHMSWVPAPNKYDKTINWDKNFPTRNYGRFFTNKRYMLSEDIENAAKKKVSYLNGKNPGPANYEADK